MKKLLIMLLLAMPLSSANAIKYRSLGITKFAAYTFDDVKYLLLMYEDKDKDYQLSPNTIIKFKLNNGEVLKLENTQAGERHKSSAISGVYGVTSISSRDIHYVLFEVTQEMLKMLDAGIKRMAINTLPEVYIYGGEETKKFGALIKSDLECLKNEMDDDNPEIQK